MTKRNRWVSLFLTLMFLTVGATGAWALDLKIADVTVPAGTDGFEVTVDFSEATTIQGGEFDIAYDDTVLTFVEGTAPSDLSFSTIGIVDGNIKVMLAGMSTTSVTTAATLIFNIASDASGTIALTFADTSVGFHDGTNPNAVIFTPVEGSISVATNPEVTGIVGQGGSVTVDGADAAGLKTFSDGATPEYIIDPDDDYRIAAFTIDSVNQKDTLTDNGDGTFSYTFGALSAGDSPTLEVTFEPIPYPTVTVVKGANGGMTTPDGTATGVEGQKRFAIGATPTYTIAPSSGYKVDTLLKGEEDITAGIIDNTYTLAPLAEGAAITLNVTFAEIVYPIVIVTGDANVVLSSASGTEIEPGKKSYEVNATPIYTITPDTGYKIATFMVDDADAMDALTNNTYTFGALAEGGVHTIAATSVLIGFPTITGSAGAGGTLTVDGADATGEKTYDIDATPAYKATPDANYVIDTFMVNGTDVKAELVDNTYTFAALVEGDTHTVDVTFKMDNAVPTATAGTLEAEVGKTTTGQLAGEDTDGTVASYQIVTNPTKGFVDITDAATGAYSFEARSSAAVGDTDTFTFTVTDDKGAVSDPATITITFIRVNNSPVPDAGLILEASATGATIGQLSATDFENDPLTYRIVDQPATGGAVTLTDAATGAYTFNVFAGATGTVTFTFQVNDGTADADAPGTVTVNIGMGNHAPVAQDGTLNLAAGATVTGTLIATDEDTGDVLTFSIVAQPANGVVALTDTASGAYEYTANTDATGADSFAFKATDSNGVESNTATVNVTVIPGIEVTGTVAPGIAGTITPDITSVIEGGEVTFTITVEADWEIDTVMDNGVDVTSDLTAENTYTLSGITEPHDIIVTLIPEVVGIYSSADYGAGEPDDAHDYKISLSELLRVVQFYTIGAYHCDPNGEDGYAAGDGDQDSCDPNTSDYNTQDWEINLSELLRIVQFYVLGGYHVVPDGEVDTEGDGFIAGAE